MTQGNINKGMSEEDLKYQKAAEMFTKRMEAYPLEEQIAIGLVMRNILNGCTWEFVRNNPDVRKNAALFAGSKHCSLLPIKNGHIVTMTMQRVLEILNKEASGLLRPKDLELASRHRQEALVALDKKMKEGYEGKIGIFCTNDSTSITIKGKRYPAFAITLQELLSVCIRNRYGLMLGKLRTPGEVAANAEAVVKLLDLAPSSNALMIQIAKM